MHKWTRRAFITSGLVAGGGLVVGVTMRPGNRVEKLSGLVGDQGGQLVHAYVKIDTDNVVTALVPHSEMGQGVHTALGQMLAEELDADWDRVLVEEAPAIGEYASYGAGRGYLLAGIDFPDIAVPSVDGMMMRVADALDMQITGGSMSVRTTGVIVMRVAGAATRQMLRQAAADAWSVSVDEIITEDSFLIHRATANRAPYSEFASTVAGMTPSYTPTLKDPSDFKLIGRSVPRRDIPAKVDGSLKFALDVRLPDMLYATVMRSPVFGATIESLDDTAARAVEGVVEIVRIPPDSFSSMLGAYNTGETVAVVADSYWSAKKGLDALQISWSDIPAAAASSDEIFAQFDRDITARTERANDIVQGNVDVELSRAAQVLEADYHVPYLAHSCMEPMNATAHVSDDRAEIWVGCQNPLGFRRQVAAALNLDEENVTLHNHSMGGGFGRRAVGDYAVQAARVAQVVGRPVQLIWSREEDVRQDFYRPAVQSRFRAALDSEGNLLAWENTYTNKNEPIEAPLIPYAVPSQDIGYVSSPTHVPFGAWRSVDHSQHGFFTESFIDEAAHAAGKDPFEFRADLLRDHPRHLAVLTRAAEEAQWGRPLAAGRGRGISLQESFGSLVAQVVEVTVTDGQLSVDRVVAAIDAGTAISPNGISAQVESGIIYGLTAALHGEITIENGAVVQGNFDDYEAVRMDEAPVIETYIVNSGYAIGGAGEPGTPGIAPALANAVYDATGIRVRQLPFDRFNFNIGGEESGVAG